MLVGDHQASGLAENAVKNAQGQFRVIKDALKSRHGRRVDGEHQVAPWMVPRAALVVNRGRKDEEGFSGHRRWKRERVYETSSRVRRMCALRAGDVGREEQVRQQMERRSVVRSLNGER